MESAVFFILVGYELSRFLRLGVYDFGNVDAVEEAVQVDRAHVVDLQQNEQGREVEDDVSVRFLTRSFRRKEVGEQNRHTYARHKQSNAIHKIVETVFLPEQSRSNESLLNIYTLLVAINYEEHANGKDKPQEKCAAAVDGKDPILNHGVQNKRQGQKLG